MYLFDSTLTDSVDLVICSTCGMSEGRCGCGKGEVILSGAERKRISKFLSGMLRHFPEKYGIEIDRNGFASLESVIAILKERYGVGESHLRAIVQFDRKRRFEIVNGKIRARYGHSTDVDVRWSESGRIPERLYHATSPENLKSILSVGLIPVRRREVHMTEKPDEAMEVGFRHSRNPVLLEIDAERVMGSGIEIRKKGRVFTADRIPPEFIRVVEWRRR